LCALTPRALTAQQAAPAPPDTAPVPVVGVVYSVAQAPLANAIVQLVSFTNRSLTYAAKTDSTGAFRIPSVQHGRYLIGFLHPALDSLGLSPPQLSMEVGDAAAHAVLAIPSARTLRARICRSAPTDSTGVLL